MSLLVLLLITGLVLLLVTSLAVYRRLVRPVTKGVGWCLARRRPADPADLPAAAEKLSLQLANGTPTAGWKIQGQSPDAPGCIICHGHSASRQHALLSADLLRASFRWVVVFDQRGHGQADDARCSLGIHEPQDTAAVIEQVAQPDEPIVLMGYSMGSRIALRAASLPAVKPRLVGLILEGYFREWWQPVAGVLRERQLPAFAIVPVLRLFSRCAGRFHRADTLDPVDVPTLLIHGQYDELCPPEGSRWLAHQLREAQLVEIDGGHSDLTLAQPEAYREAVGRWALKIKSPPHDADAPTIGSRQPSQRPAGTLAL